MTNQSGSVHYDIEIVNEAIKLLIDGHSDMTFLTWPHEHERREVKVYSENCKRRRGHRVSSNQSRQLYKCKVRHYMIEDNKEKLPFTTNPLQQSNSKKDPLGSSLTQS